MVSFGRLADLYEGLEATSSGNRLREILSSFFKNIPKDEVERVTYLTLGNISSDYADVNLGLGWRMVLRSIAEASGTERAQVMKLFKQTGDPGLVAERLVGRRRKALSVKEVFGQLHRVAAASGAGSQESKIRILANLLRNASPKEAKYLCRIVLMNMRLGVADKTVLDALAVAFTGKRENKRVLEQAYNICPDVGVIAGTLVRKGLPAVKRIGVMVGRPIMSMLCQRIDRLAEIPAKMGTPFAVEEKYDGERIQAHKDGAKVTLFSRRLEDITSQFPDIAAEIRGLRAKSVVIDSEVMPVDAKGKLLKFQVLMSRRRKYGVEEFALKIPVVLFAFDVLFLNGKSLIAIPYEKRYALLQRIVRSDKWLKLANRTLCNDPDCAEELFSKVVAHGGEGIVIKDLKGAYEAGTRGWRWIKWKPEYTKELRDTFDLVVVGAFYGTGRRGGMLSSYLCAAYDPAKDRFGTFTKVASGFSDAELKSMHKRAMQLRIPHRPARLDVKDSMKPDVWIEPKLVIEVLGAEITKSPNHTAAGGLALRFPRFLRVRTDKSAEEATTVKEILKMVKQ
ncbi:ATP-dependent DNA ligase [Candidatus Woesearchaeota archaeon]|nr:ATP-dependent DNA ligase [Candidatus Woesearchaeota archaeon]